MNYPNELIKTKLIIEIYPARFFSIGFGNLVDSEANVVCVSSFIEDLNQTIEYFYSIDSTLFWDAESPQRQISIPTCGKVKAVNKKMRDVHK